MEALEAIFSRRSIRKFTAEPVLPEDLLNILKAGQAAPSAGNAQAWRFIILDEREILDEVPKFHPYAQMIKQASLAVVVCGDLGAEKYPGYWVQDCAAATQNMLLAVTALGLGAVWTGLYPNQERVAGMRALLGLPEKIVPLSLVVIGHPDEHKPKAERFDPAKLSRNAWQG